MKFGSLTYYFSDGEFTKDTTFTSEVKPNEEEVSYIPVIILSGGVFALFIAACIWLSLQKEKAVDYKIRIWKDRQDAEKYNQFAQKDKIYVTYKNKSKKDLDVDITFMKINGKSYYNDWDNEKTVVSKEIRDVKVVV